VSARVIDGRARAEVIRAEVAARASAFAATRGRPVTLAAVLVGDDPSHRAYAQSKGRATEKCGLAFRLVALPGDAGTDAVVDTITGLGDDPTVDGIMVELPLPGGYDPSRVTAAMDPARDVDGVTADSRGRLLGRLPGPRPATALAVMDLLDVAGVDLEGASAVVVGRSPIVGLPTALLLLAAHATVTVAHTRTRDLAAVSRAADILVVTAGVAALIGPDHIRPGAVVIDVGTNAVAHGDGMRIVGDVDFDRVLPVAGAITPVPGGVGPVTTAIALRTAVALAERRA
jgi:methylenetetrahydrofolate dehydrogenase (NADP+) / methenyltetrahydrofolate cyclohydrolase